MLHLLHTLPGARHSPSDRLDEIVEVTSRFVAHALASQASTSAGAGPPRPSKR